MTDTSSHIDVEAGPGRADAGGGDWAGSQVDVRGLDDGSVLDAMRNARRVADRAEAGLLRFAVHYVDLHPVTDEHPGATPGDGDRCLQDGLAGPDPSDGGPVGLGGAGTPGIAEYAVEALGGHLALSYRATYGLLGEAVELCYRLPRLWDLVQAGRLQAWKARQVTAHTRSVSAAAAEFVDRHLARDAARNRVPTLARLRALTHEALLQCDPETALGREEAALAARDVTFDHRAATSTGMSTMTATLDTLDALDLHDTLAEMATTMSHFGDTSPLGVRRAHALGMLARPDLVLDLFTSAPGTPSVDGPDDTAEVAPGATAPTPVPSDEGGAGPAPVIRTPFNRATTTLYVHVNADDLQTGTDTGLAGVERLGAATLDLIRDWLRRSSHLTIRPVVHAPSGRTAAVTRAGIHATTASTTDPFCRVESHLDPCCRPVDRHDPSSAMREAVILRDGHCVFPGCTVDARSCDLDHLVAYLDPDDGGPPGQTSLENLGCLCRRHHRLKTFTAWTYRRLLDGSYAWTSPAGRSYLAAPTAKTAPRFA